MEVLAGAASGFAAVSLAIQLAESITKLHSFWDSVREAPHEIRSVVEDLKLLSQTLMDIAVEERDHGPLCTNTEELVDCCATKVTRLQDITKSFQSGLESGSKRMRKWSAFKIARKKRMLAALRKSLDETKATLILAKQSCEQRFLHSHHDQQSKQLASVQMSLAGFDHQQQRVQRAIEDISQSLSKMRIQGSSEVTSLSGPSNISDHRAALEKGIESVASDILNPILRAGFAAGMSQAIRSFEESGDIKAARREAQSRASGFQATPRPSATPRTAGSTDTLEEAVKSTVQVSAENYETAESSQTHSRDVRRYTRRKRLAVQGSFCESKITNFFGTIIFRYGATLTSGHADNDCCARQMKTINSFVLHPAPWLIKCGIRYGIELAAVHARSGWSFNCEPIRTVPNDSIIFHFCTYGNVDAVRCLFDRNEASVLDTDSVGWRPLHYATNRGHFELSKFLVSRGADSTARGYGAGWTGCIPVELIGSSSDDQTEIFLLFEEHIDFDQVGSVGWTLLESTAFNDTMGGQGSSSSTWLIGRYRQQMTESIDESAIFEAMCMSLCDFDQTLLRMLVDLSEDAINYRDRHDTRSYGVLGEVIENLLWIRDYDNLADKFGLLCERGANLHLICAGETPTSRALGFSFVFRKWMDLLHRAGWGFEEIVKGELTSTEYPLYKRGWRVATLKDLFDFCSRFYWEGVSTSCHTDGQFSVSGILAEPWWEELLQKFRARECVCSFLEKCELSGLLKPSSPVHDFEESEKPLHDHIDDHSYNHGELPREDDVTSNEGHVMWSDTRANSEPLDVSVGNGQPSSDVSMNIHICDWRSPEWRDRYISGSQTWEDYSKATSKDDSEEATNEGSQGDLEENSEENSVEMRDEGDALPEDPCVDECAVHRFYRWSWDIPEDYNRETVMHDFFARGGTWRRWYAPGHLYHWKCLAMLEAREDELRAPIDEDESATASMPGAFIP